MYFTYARSVSYISRGIVWKYTVDEISLQSFILVVEGFKFYGVGGELCMLLHEG